MLHSFDDTFLDFKKQLKWRKQNRVCVWVCVNVWCCLFMSNMLDTVLYSRCNATAFDAKTF